MRSALYILIFVSAAHAALSSGSAEARPARKQGRSAAPVVSVAAAQASGLSSAELTKATQLYTTKCMRCHKSYEPGGYSQAEWDSWMIKMHKKAHLTQDQQSLLSHYLTASRAVSPSLAKTNTTAPQSEQSRARRSD
jgi:cytochrome c5